MPRRRKVLLLGAAAALTTAAVLAVALTGPERVAVSAEDVTIAVFDGPQRDQRVALDATLYLPESTPAPAVLVAHGFGGSKMSVATEATALARRGFVVLAYSARGFGHSTGRIALNAPDYEVADARQLLDWLARRPEVRTDGPGDPRVGVTGGSYGGALALLLAGYDDRVDAVAAQITYNDLTQALFPNAASTGPVPSDTPAAGASAPDGVFKQAWAGVLFATGRSSADPVSGPDRLRGDPEPCGRFRTEICRAYLQAATTGRISERLVELLRRASPATVTDRIDAPTLLVQGQQDTLFGLAQADATARQLAAAGTPVRMVWYAGGHDGDPPGSQLREDVGDWLAYRLAGVGDGPDTGFEYQVRSTFGTGEPAERTVQVPTYPGLQGDPVGRRELTLQGGAQQVIRPPGGVPAALSSLPGLGALARVPGAIDVGTALPDQTAMFVTDPLAEALQIAGSAQLSLRIAAAATGRGAAPLAPAPDEAVLFVKLYDVAPDGGRVLAGGGVAPIRVGPLPADGSPVDVTVTLAGTVRPVEAGHRLAVAVATTDRAYSVPDEPAAYTVSLGGDSSLAVPYVPGEQVAAPLPVAQLAGFGGLALLVGALTVTAALRRHRAGDHDPGLAAVPLVIDGLTKRYPGGLTAVDGLTFRVPRGQVLGLLGPNGAGKTTVLRMLMGMVRPSAGGIRVFGHRVEPGVPVLSRVGSFVEGAGFLPHLSGWDNLRMHWAATGRPVEAARFDEALAIAGLGTAVHRRVRTYSQGMRQRLAIAQAMLGLPELLVLDEPTNGLDPPQIHAMREVLRGYAAAGRTVLVSSHLLAEVEQTCSHVVVMHHGRLVTAGAVEELIAGDGQASFTVDEPEAAAEVLRGLDGVGAVDVVGSVVHAELDGTARSVAVSALVRAGVPVSSVGPRRRLEDAFLQLVGEETVE